MANTGGSPSVLSQLKFDKPYHTHGLAIPLISVFLVLAAIGLVITIIRFRFLGQKDLSEDILLAVLSFSLATAGIALSALANGTRTKLMLEAASIEARHINAIEVIELRQKLLAAVSDRLGKIVISANLSLDATTNKTAQATWQCEDKSGSTFNPDEAVFELSWHSTNPAIATVDGNGVVTRVATGTANVMAYFNRFQSTTCVVNCA